MNMVTLVVVFAVASLANGGVARSVVGLAAPPPSPAPVYNLSWKITYNMSMSTFVNPDGNYTGPEVGQRLELDAKFGIITFDGRDQLCLINRHGPPEDPCMYRSTQALHELNARNINAINPDTKVFTYHNQEEALLRRKQDCEIMIDPAYESFFIHNTTGIVNNPVGIPASICTSVANASAYTHEDQYALNFSNPAVSEWWLDSVIGDFLKSKELMGFYWDCPSLTSPFNDYMSEEEEATINGAMEDTRNIAKGRIAAAGKWALSMFEEMGTPNDCPAICRLNWRPSANCSKVCTRTPTDCLNQVRKAAANMYRPSKMTIPFLARSSEPNKASCNSGPSLVAATDSLETELSLTCLPGTGSMTVDFASYGLPNVTNPNGRFVECGYPDCTDMRTRYWEDMKTKTLFKVGPGATCSRNLSPATNVSAAYLASLTMSIQPFTCANSRDCAAFAANTECDAGPAVLQQIKSMCDGKQSCRFTWDNLTLPTLPPSCDPAKKESFRLAVKASGCQQGTATASFREHLAYFLLARGPYSFMGHDWIAGDIPIRYPEWELDYGKPVSPMEIDGMVVSRSWSRMKVSLDCSTFEAQFDPVN